MPGFSFICDLKGHRSRNERAMHDALDALLHDRRRYEPQVLLQDDFYFLACTGYKEYPVEVFQCGDVSIYLEGQLYGTDAVSRKTKLSELAGLAFGSGADEAERIGEWLFQCDGDFVIFLFQQKTGEVMIVNDLFSRLPLYCYRTDSTLIVSRELRFIARLMNGVRFDRMALAQYLLFGYPLGKRTLLDNVERLTPATRIRINPLRAVIHVERLHQFNVESRQHARSSIEVNAAALVEMFSESCRARNLPGMEYVVSLSGGFDSRAVATCMHRIEIPFRCATFLDHVGNAAPDVPVAMRLAQLFEVEWKLFELGPPTRSDVLTLLRMKNGMNPLGMAFLLPFLEAIRETSDSPVFFVTGETHALRDFSAPLPLKSLQELVRYLITRYAKFSLDDVAALTGLPPSDIVDELRLILTAYPEHDCNQKYLHFIIAERDLKWLAEGEDRNRCYFWSTSPFYRADFFEYAMNCPDEQKSYYGLYGEFLVRLSPAAAAIELAGIGLPATSAAFTTALKALALLESRPDLQKRLKVTFGSTNRYNGDSIIIKFISRQLANGDSIYEYLSPAALKRIVEQFASYTAEELDHLFTITSIIEDLTTGKSVLE